MASMSSSKMGSESPSQRATKTKPRPRPTGAIVSPKPTASQSKKTNEPPLSETFSDEENYPIPKLPEAVRKAKPPVYDEDQLATPQLKPVLTVPTGDEAIVNNLMARELLDPSGPVEPPSPTVALLAKLVDGMKSGSDLGPIREELTRIVNNQAEKADLFVSVMNQIEQERSIDWLIARAASEKVLKRASLRGDLTTLEAMAIWRLAHTALSGAQAQASKAKSIDTVTVVQKVDIGRADSEREVERRWENTTPQGREIIRKKLFSLKREIMALQPEISATPPAPAPAEQTPKTDTSAQNSEAKQP